MEKFFLSLLLFLPLAIAGQLLGFPPVWIFVTSAIAIIPLAKLIGQATEELAARAGASWGGFLNASFGNATELIIAIFALRAGLIDVVKATITGSIISNLLLVLGTAMIAGGLRNEKQEFNRTAALASGSTLFLAAMALLIPTLLPATAQTAISIASTNKVSIITAVLMLIMYAATLVFSLRTHKHLYVIEELPSKELAEGWTAKKSVFVLVAATLAVAWMSELLVGAINPLLASFGWTPLFLGVIVLALIGNAAEHASAITVAMKNKMDLALQITIGSATQIAMFVAPVLVLVSIFFPVQMNLIFNPFELAAIILAVLIVNIIIADGESNWLEGLQLVIAYGLMAVAFALHP